MNLIVYGDFNCPYSALASYRMDRLLAAGRAEVEFRAVEHEPDIPPEGQPIEGELREQFDREVQEVNELVRADERFALRVPSVRPKTSDAIVAFASLTNKPAHDLRRRLFGQIWLEGGDPGPLGEPTEESRARARGWESEWQGLERRIVPMLVLPDGYVSRGLGALRRLADLLDG